MLQELLKVFIDRGKGKIESIPSLLKKHFGECIESLLIKVYWWTSNFLSQNC